MHTWNHSADGRALEAWAQAYEWTFGQRPTFEPAQSDRCARIRFPDVLAKYRDASRMVGSVEFFGMQPAMRAHVRRVGFDWDDDGYIHTVPAPLELNAMVRALGFEDHGLTLRYFQLDAIEPTVGYWLRCATLGVQPLSVASPAFYRRRWLRDRAKVGWASFRGRDTMAVQDDLLRRHLCLIQHDMTRHVLPLHLVPRAAIRALAARMERLARGRLRTWMSDPDYSSRSPTPALRFWENDLIVYAHRVWDISETPQEFVKCFMHPPYFKLLEEIHDQRVEMALNPSTEYALTTGYRPKFILLPEDFPGYQPRIAADRGS